MQQIMKSFFAFLALFMATGTGIANAACSYYLIDSNLLNVRSNAKISASIIDVLEKDDVVCVEIKKNVSRNQWGYVPHKISDGKEVEVKGWSHLRFAKHLTNDQFTSWAREVGVALNDELRVIGKTQPASTTTTTTTTRAAPVQEKPAAPARDETKTASVNQSDVTTLRFTEPVPFGAWPVQGRTLKQLANSLPLFAPMEGLPENVWKKNCTQCHKWNRKRLCSQGKTYVKKVERLFRIQHPFGGPYKNALKTWSNSGCKE